MATTLRARLRSARKLAGISAKQLDRLAGLGAGHTNMIESGTRVDIEGGTLAKLCKALGVSLDWLLLGGGKAPTVNSVRSAIALASSPNRKGQRLRATGTDG